MEGVCFFLSVFSGVFGAYILARLAYGLMLRTLSRLIRSRERPGQQK